MVPSVVDMGHESLDTDLLVVMNHQVVDTSGEVTVHPVIV